MLEILKKIELGVYHNRQGICSSHLSFVFGYCLENGRVHFLLVPSSHVIMTPQVNNFCSLNLLRLVSMEREFFVDQYLLQNLQLIFVCFWVIDLQTMDLMTIVQKVNLFLSQNLLYYLPLEREFYAIVTIADFCLFLSY